MTCCDTNPEQKLLYTICIFTENHVGLLNQLSIIFTRRCLNIESCSASKCSIEGVHKITLTCYSDRRSLEKAVLQIEKRIDVLKAFLYTDNEVVYQEVALYKVLTSELFVADTLEEILRRHQARILDIKPNFTIIERTGHNEETEALYHELKPYGITQFVRSGRVAITKSPDEMVDDFIEKQERRRKLLTHDS